MDFGRQLFGYKRSAVDRHIADQDAALVSLRAEIGRLRAAEPLLSASDEISALLTSFAVAVSTTREQAERDAIATRRAADEYAEGLKAETVRLCNEDRARAAAQAKEMVARAQEEIGALHRAQERVGSALNDAARGIYSLMELFEHARMPEAQPARPVSVAGAAGAAVAPGPGGAGGPTGSPTTLPGGGPTAAPGPGVAAAPGPGVHAPPGAGAASPSGAPTGAPGGVGGGPGPIALGPITPVDALHTSEDSGTASNVRPAGRPFGEVPVDPQSQMVVDFAPPAERREEELAEPDAVSGPAEPEWHQGRSTPGWEGAEQQHAHPSGHHPDGEQPEQPGPWGT